jgi:hypothetical protein
MRVPDPPHMITGHILVVKSLVSLVATTRASFGLTGVARS